jgi:probable phosphoglycerate mutase
MLRARRTAEIAGFPDPQVTPLLQEFDYGEYEGLTSAEINQAHPGWDLFRDGCPGGETPTAAYVRAAEFISLALESEGGDVLAFAHGHIIRTIAVAWMSLDVTAGSRLLLDVATLSKLVQDDRGRELAMWNAP